MPAIERRTVMPLRRNLRQLQESVAEARTDRARAAALYRLAVFHDGNGVRAINPVYWGRTRIASGPQTEPTLAPVAC